MLHRRHIETMSTCELRGARDETSLHGLTECTYARLFWEMLRKYSGFKLPEMHPSTWIKDLLDEGFCPKDEAASSHYMWHVDCLVC